MADNSKELASLCNEPLGAASCLSLLLRAIYETTESDCPGTRRREAQS